ncbi:MAG: GntR family transcriptional regulator [Paracoccaceae bacterium]
MTQTPARIPHGQAARPAARPAPRYAAIARTVARAIETGALHPGTILTEGRLAALFGTSRTPVRTALAELNRQGRIDRFEGRGFVVPGAPPTRARIAAETLGLSPDHAPEPPTASAERIARSFEDAIARALPFGLFRINEQAAADHYGVSRQVVRELLSRLQDRGLVRKDLRSHWVTGPLTARDLGHYFDIRARLEPLALRTAAQRLDPRELDRMRNSLHDTLRHPDTLDPERLETLETDLHTSLLAQAANPYLLRMIRQTQVALVVNRLFANTVGAKPFATALEEHAITLDLLARHAIDAAEKSLETHLLLAKDRTTKRLMAVSVFPQPNLPQFLRKMKD